MTSRFSFGSFVAGFMLGALCIGAWAGGNGLFAPSLPSSPAHPTNASTIPTSQSNAISVANQPAGMATVVESVTVPPPGVWVAVREVNGNDLGNVLGAVRVGGPRSQISVPLLRATEPNSSYAVELYRDDGGTTFDLATDSVYIDFATGEPVIAYFSTSN